MESLVFSKADPSSLSREQVKTQLLQSGLWPFLKQRPYGILAKTADVPKNIFISCFDSAPLAPDYSFIMKGQEKMLQTGINALAKLTDGKVFLGLPDGNGRIRLELWEFRSIRYHQSIKVKSYGPSICLMCFSSVVCLKRAR